LSTEEIKENKRKKRKGKLKRIKDRWQVVSGWGDFLLFKTPYY